MIKSVVLPYEVFNKLNTRDSNNYSLNKTDLLEKELGNILSNNGLSADEKTLLYTQMLQKFVKDVQHRQSDVELPVNSSPLPSQPVSPSPTSAGSASSTVLPNNLKDILLQAAGKNRQRYAGALFDFLENSSDVSWDKNTGVVFVSGNKIDGSNIIDIVLDLSRPSYSSKLGNSHPPPLGTKNVLDLLVKINAPQVLIRNSERIKNRTTVSSEKVLHSPQKNLPPIIFSKRTPKSVKRLRNLSSLHQPHWKRY